VERLGAALLAIVCAIAVALWAYGVYCYVQMVRHRIPGTNPLQVGWPPEQLTEMGREFRRRALRTYVWFAVVVLVLLVLTRLF
jgi:ABC-type branched-subunit amino acid transport system permease subunit